MKPRTMPTIAPAGRPLEDVGEAALSLGARKEEGLGWCSGREMLRD